jgi:alpha-beta hydrolase superfamily lysophospholipase/SAM-dependent methyltransferase
MNLSRGTTAAPAPAVADGMRPTSEHRFISHDGTQLFYRAWIPGDDGAINRAILLLHRGHEHSGRWNDLAAALIGTGTAVFAWDARGHGQSPGERGDAENCSIYVRDLDCFARHLQSEYEIALKDFVVIGHSVGAVVAAAWVHDFAPPIRGLVLATPAFRVKLYVPLARAGLRLLQRVKPRAFIRSYVGGGLLTHDRREAARYDADPAISRQISVRVLLDLHDTSRRIVADAGAIRVPTLVLAAGSDAVVRRGPQQEFVQRLSSSHKTLEVLDGFSHAIFHERGRERVYQRINAFMNESFARAAAAADALLTADAGDYTKTEYDALRQPCPALSFRGISFATQRVAMSSLLRLSAGVRLGRQTGFDSGQSLDYVYENQPRGFLFFGRLIDRQYLDAIGWRGIRQRKIHLRKLLESVIRQGLNAGVPVRILDIAAGPGRYLLETLGDFAGKPVTALLRDRSESALEAGRQLAHGLGLADAVRYEAGDAFAEAGLAALRPRPTVAVVSGLYELFPDNAGVLASLRGLQAALEAGGMLIYTNQPWHPQVEMIARVLTNREGKPWIMRRRTQAEMDALVQAAGFEKVAMEIDRWGIFTVSLARKARTI